MGNYTANADDTLTNWESAAPGKWNHVIVATDNVGITTLATLTWDASRPLNQILAGQNGDGSDPGAGNRCGKIDILAGLTLTFDGNATNTNSGLKSSPSATGAETKNNLLTIGAGCTFTNSVGNYNASNKWCINWAWGMVSANVAFTMKYCGGNNETWLLFGGSSQSNATSHIIGNLTIFVGGASAAAINPFTLPATNDIPFAAGFLTFDATGITANQTIETFFAGRVGTVECSVKGFRTINTPAGRIITYRFNAVTQTAGNIATSAIRVGACLSQATEVVPTGLTLANLQDGTVKVTVSNFAAGTHLVLYDGSGNVRAAIPYADYVATVDRKPANCMLVAGVPLSEISTWTAKFTSDFFVYSAACAAAGAVTPTFVPAESEVEDGKGYGQGAAEFEGTLVGGRRLFSMSC